MNEFLKIRRKFVKDIQIIGMSMSKSSVNFCVGKLPTVNIDFCVAAFVEKLSKEEQDLLKECIEYFQEYGEIL